jgi:DNA-binding transcriptional LysR family regulator
MFNDLLDLQIIWEVAKHRSFAAAARSLGQPPATVSRRVSSMERNAGVRLFERTTRSVKVTEQGQLVVTHVRRILDETQAVQTSIESMRDAPTGKIRISAPVILAEALLGPVVQKFLMQNPECQAFIDIANHKVDLIEEQYDVAIRVGDPGDLDLIARSLGVVETGLYLAPSGYENKHLLNATKPSELINANVMQLKGNDQYVTQLTLIDKNSKEETVTINNQLTTNNPVVIMQAGEKSQSLMVLPHMLTAEKVRQGELKHVLPDWVVNRAEVYAVMTSRKLVRPAVRAFLDIIVSSLRKKL